MLHDEAFIIGEFARTIDDRFRISLPSELLEPLAKDAAELVLVKERRGCLSAWNPKVWEARWQGGIDLIRQKMRLGRLEGRIQHVQRFGRLLSSRYRAVSLAQKGRLVIPEGFREFLAVEPGGEVMVVGAAVCVELWHPQQWRNYLETQMPKFTALFQHLSE
ncbi:MAG: division/cell wall cluster transcriptional repressor MraZ [Thermogutta sp.]